MKTRQSQETTLTTNEALVLQQVYEDGGDDMAYLAAHGDERAGGFAE